MHISEDMKTITLEVPLGGVVYAFMTKCNDACLHQGDNPNRDKLNCSCFSMCHTELFDVVDVVLTLQNLSFILPQWGVLYFKTYDEALQAGESLIKKHQELMKENGYSV